MQGIIYKCIDFQMEYFIHSSIWKQINIYSSLRLISLYNIQLISSISMRPQRNKNNQDWNKPFLLVNSKAVFDQITNQDDLLIHQHTSSANERQINPEALKQNIITPKIEIVKRVTIPKSHASLTPSYIRLPQHLNLPKENHYELMHVDYAFIESQRSRFQIDGKSVFTPSFLENAFVALEVKAGRDTILPKNKGWMTTFIEKQYRYLLEMKNYEEFAELVYNFWRSRREELKFPLYRPLWRPDSNDLYYLLAFRLRKRDPRVSRRSGRMMEDQIMKELQEQFILSEKMIDRIQFRQELKLKQVQAQILSFNNQCKSFAGLTVPGFIKGFEERQVDWRVRDRERLKKTHGSLSNYKTKRQEKVTDMVSEDIIDSAVLDNKGSIVSFLSSVVCEAELLSIDYDAIFNPSISSNSLVKNNISNISKILDRSGGSTLDPLPLQPRITSSLPSPLIEDRLCISLKRIQNLIIRSFDDPLPQFQFHPHKAIASNYLDLKAQRVEGYYFGEEDEEDDMKDLRKNTAASFKKFQQICSNSSSAFITGSSNPLESSLSFK